MMVCGRVVGVGLAVGIDVDDGGDRSSTTTIQNILDLPHFVPHEASTYYIDPDHDPSTPLRVMYTISEEGWLQWIGAFKPEDAVGEDRFVGVSINTVSNLKVDACEDQRSSNPPIGPTVDDLAYALAELPPFQVTKPPTEVTIYGYSGKPGADRPRRHTVRNPPRRRILHRLRGRRASQLVRPQPRSRLLRLRPRPG